MSDGLRDGGNPKTLYKQTTGASDQRVLTVTAGPSV